MRRCNPTKPGNRLGMPIEAWPVPDRLAWEAAFAPGSLFDERPHGRDLREATRITLATCYARWLAWLKANEPRALDLDPGERVTRARLIAYLQALHQELTLRTVFNYACRLKSVLGLIAPAEGWSWFTPLLQSLERRARASASKPRPIITSDQLFAFGIALMKEAEDASALPPKAQAEAYRDGLMIAFLAARPLRAKNMLELEIGQYFNESGTGYEVSLPGHLTKPGIDLEFLLPLRLGPFMGRYLSHYREILRTGSYGPQAADLGQVNFLWLAKSGQRFPIASFEDMISRRTSARFGIRLTPHDFRHCAATSIAEHNPAEFHIIRVILGHTTIATAEQHYIHAKSLDAVRLVQRNVITKRKPLAKGGKPADPPSLGSTGAMLFAGQSERYKRGFTR